MSSSLRGFESDTRKSNDNVAATVKEQKKFVGEDTRATALVSMTKDEKARLTTKAKQHGLSLSAFFRLAADEYIANHDCECLCFV